MERRIKYLLLCFGLCVFVNMSQASMVLVEYDLQNHSTSNTSVAVIENSDFLTGSDLTASGVSLLADYGDGIYVANGWAETQTLDLSKYYEWTITPEIGYEISYDNIDLSLVRGNWLSVHGAQGWELHASTDGFKNSDIYLNSWDISGSGYDQIQVFETQDISALGTQASSVTFRLYGYDADGTNDYSGLAYSHADLGGTGTSLSVYGNIQAVPEPATLAMLGLGGLAVAYKRCRI